MTRARTLIISLALVLVGVLVIQCFTPVTAFNGAVGMLLATIGIAIGLIVSFLGLTLVTGLIIDTRGFYGF